MKIGIDISPIIYGTGVSVYTKNLMENLLLEDKRNRYVFFGGSLRRKNELDSYLASLKGDFEASTFSIPPTLADMVWNRLHIFRIENLLGKLDVFHSSDWTQPPTRAFKVTTIHDLSPVLFPELTNPKVVRAHKARLKWVKKEVNRVIVPSQTTKEDCEKLGINSENIRIVPEAVNPLITPASKKAIEELKEKYQIKGNYMLAVGVNARKNTDRIVEAFLRTRLDVGAKMVVIGHPYAKQKQHGDVVFTGHVSQEDMPVFYSGAEALIYPSLYEGFGIPILEAFTCGVPVVTSNLGSMAEIAGNAAVLVDPYDVGAISEGILKVIANSNELIKRGHKEVSKYSWEKAAKKTIEVYEDASI